MAYYSSKLWGKKKAWNIEAFIAPANFDPASQQLNIVSLFGDYDNANKAYIYSFTSAIATLTLPASSGVTYRWGETIDGIDYVYDVVSGTAFTAGSTKRYVIVNSTATSVFANLSFSGSVWLYCSSKCYQVFARANTYLKYVHCEDLNSITTIGSNAFYGCTGLTGALTIPNLVTTIGVNAFVSCTGLTGTLTIPNTVTTIGNYAFYNCTGLTGTLTIPSSVTTIGNYAFQSCTGLTGALTIPNSVTTIGSYAFQNCTGFTGTLTIPNSVTTIGQSAFPGTSFTHLVSNSSYFEVYDEVLYTTTGTITAIYSAKGYSGTLTLKSNVVVIDYGCFYNNNLRTGTLTIPNSVTTIGNYAFQSCTGLTGALTIPNSVTTIGSYAFQNCTGFTGTLTIPNSVTTIGTVAFQSCTGFTSLTLSEGLLTIGGNAFYGCSGFTGTLTIPNSVTTIGGYAFFNCNKLSGIGTINGSPAIGGIAFYGLPLISEWHIISQVAPSVQSNTWGNYAKPLHVKIGATGYDVAPFTNTAIFSSIIYDL